jgi:hypothetical protein
MTIEEILEPIDFLASGGLTKEAGLAKLQESPAIQAKQKAGLRRLPDCGSAIGTTWRLKWLRKIRLPVLRNLTPRNRS